MRPRSQRKPSSRHLRPIEVPVAIDALVEDLTYEKALQFLEQRPNFERVRPSISGPQGFQLDRMRALMAALGNPQDSLRSIHVAGSKGKGSTVEMLAASLSGCGHAVGVYMSPHVMDVRERIRIGNEMIPEATFASLVTRVWRAATGIIREHGEVTFFEMMTAMALCYFASEAVDLAVVEVGLGGRLDATNVIRPEVTVITAIQLEHTDILGDTLEKIAREKAGIMKQGVPCITVPQDSAALTALREVAIQVGAPLDVVGETLNFSYRLDTSPSLGPHARILLLTPHSAFEHLAVPLKGEHQALNCGAALAAIDVLRRNGMDAPEVKVAAGLAQTPNHARFEIIQQRPRVMVDGAHNPESIEGLIRAVGLHLRVDSTIIVFGCAQDKDCVGMLRKLARGADKVIFTRAAGNARAADPRDLARKFEAVSGHMAQVAPNVREALELAARAASREDLILVTGSFYVAGEAKRIILKGATNRAPGR